MDAQESEKVYNQALTDYRDNRLDQAESALNSLIASNPGFEDAYEALAVLLYNRKAYDQAISVIKKWIQVNPNSIMAQTNLSRCFVAKDMYEEAEQAQAEARRLTWSEEMGGKNVNTESIDFKEQIDRYKQVIELDPKDVLGYYSLGSVYLNSGQLKRAKEAFSLGLEVDPTHSSSYLSLGQTLEKMQHPEQAVSIYREGVKVADKQGDIVPLKKMEARLAKIDH